jgi:hypothetical protein
MLIILQGTQKGKCARDIVVGYDQPMVMKRQILPIVDVILDLAKIFQDAFIGTAFKRTSQIDADDLSQDAGIDTFIIVGWKIHW